MAETMMAGAPLPPPPGVSPLAAAVGGAPKDGPAGSKDRQQSAVSSLAAAGSAEEEGNDGAAADSGSASDFVKELEDRRRKELQSIMRDRSIGREERRSRMESSKEMYRKLIKRADAGVLGEARLRDGVKSKTKQVSFGTDGRAKARRSSPMLRQ